MKVSVVIPFKNEALIVEDCLRSLLTQTVLPDEIIAVDNGSTDRTYQKLQSLRSLLEVKGVELTVLSCPDGNQIEARTLGFGKAQHDLIATIDADTRLEPSWIVNARDFFERRPHAVGTGGVVIYDDPVVTLLHRLCFHFICLFPKNYFFYGCNGVFKRSAYQQCGGLQGCGDLRKRLGLRDTHEDVFLGFRLKKVGEVQPNPKLKARVLSRDNGRQVGTARALSRMRRQLRDTLILQRHLIRELKRSESVRSAQPRG